MSEQYFATNRKVGDGVTTVWDFSFAGARPDAGDGTKTYLEQQDVRVALVDFDEVGLETRTEIDFELIGPSQVLVEPAVPNGQDFVIYRETQGDFVISDFVDFASISERDLDDAFRQGLYAVQELRDESADTRRDANVARRDTAAALDVISEITGSEEPLRELVRKADLEAGLDGLREDLEDRLGDDLESGLGEVRGDLAAPVLSGRGALLVGGATIYVNTVADLQTLDTSKLVDGQQVSVEDVGLFVYETGGGWRPQSVNVRSGPEFPDNPKENQLFIIEPDELYYYTGSQWQLLVSDEHLQSYVDSASAQADRAEAASDAAFVNADVYASLTEGRAAVAVGEQFQVLSLDGAEFIRYRKDSEGSSTEMGRYPSTQAINALKTNAAFARSHASPIDIDTAAKSLTITEGLRFSLSTGTRAEVVPQTVTIPESPDSYLLCYDRASQTASIKTTKTNDEYVLGFVNVSGGEVSAIFDFNYTVNGNDPIDHAQKGFLATTVASRINFDTVAGTLTTTSGVRLVVDERSYLMPNDSVELPSSASNGMYNMTYDITAGTVHISNTGSTLDKSRVIFGQLLVMSGDYHVFGIPFYMQDGRASIDKIEDAKTVSTGVMVAIEPTAINFNFASKVVEIAESTTRLLFGNNSHLLPDTTVDISEGPHVWNQLVYDTDTRAFSKKRTTVSLTGHEIRVALFHVNNKEVRDVPWYSINGVPASGSDKTDLKTAEFIIPYGDVEPLYDQPELSEYATLAATNGNDFTKVYDLYDALMDEHPDYITKTLLGNDGQGSPIYQYQFNMPEVDRINQANTKPKIILVSSVHGYEKAGVYNLYFTMKEICERWAEDSKLEALKWGVNFLVVPIAVPSGFTLNQRKNHNGVDIARNFTPGWSLGDPETSTYGGAAPLDQAEAVILDALLSNNRDAIYFGSHHNYFAYSGGFIWNASGTEFGINLGKMLCIRETVKTKQRYSWMPQTNDYYIGYANLGAPNGSEGRQAVEMYGINGGTFEICERFPWEDGNPRYSSAVATIGVESLINWILLNVKHGCDLYNSRVNL